MAENVDILPTYFATESELFFLDMLANVTIYEGSDDWRERVTPLITGAYWEHVPPFHLRYYHLKGNITEKTNRYLLKHRKCFSFIF